MLADGLNALAPGLLLGLANGATCLATCAPVLVPLFLSEARSTRGNTRILLEFLVGRLAGYVSFGLAAWLTGRLLAGGGAPAGGTTGLITCGLGALMLTHGILKAGGKTAAFALGGPATRRAQSRPGGRGAGCVAARG